jgi:hypothetical protein
MYRIAVFALALFLFPVAIFAATTAALSNCGLGETSGNNATCSGTTITTGLSWSNPGGSYGKNQMPYAGVKIRITGGTGSAKSPYVWVLTDGNKNQITQLASGGVQWVDTVYGQIDCTGSADNSACVYNAPGDTTYQTPTATLTISDGATSATVNIVFFAPLNATTFFTSRARLYGFDNRPVSLLAANIGSANISFRQAEWTILQNPEIPGSEIGIVDGLDNDPCSGTLFPVTAGSAITRPAWSANGEWFNFMSNEILPASFNECNELANWVVKSSGAEKMRVDQAAGQHFMWDANVPNWIVNTDGGYPGSAIFVCDLSKKMEKTVVATYSSSRGNGTGLSANSFPSGSHYAFAQRNIGKGCKPGPGCSPDIVSYDLGPCETSLRANCAQLLHVFNIYLNASGYDEQGKPLNSSLETSLHDWNYLRDGSNRLILLYGSRGEAGQGIWFVVNEDGSAIAPFSPNQAANVPYFSHPAFNGYLVAYAGRQACNDARQRGPSHSCDNETSGNGVMDLRDTAKGAIAFSQNVSYGHAAWDGWDGRYLEHDNAGGDVVNGCFAETISEATVGARSPVSERRFFNWGCRPSNKEGNSAVGFVLGPTQSPDGTKFAESMIPSMSRGSVNLGWVFYARKPEAPLLELVSGNNVTLAVTAPPLSYEAQSFVIYKQSGCSGPWSAITTLQAVFQQRSPYRYQDPSAPANGQSACYGATQVDWSNIESDELSKVIRVTNSDGKFSATNQTGASTTGFETTAPQTVAKLSVAQKAICATGCASPNRPTEPQSFSEGPGGAMTKGKYWIIVTYTQSPNPSAYRPVLETLPSKPKSVAVQNNGTAALVVATYNKEMVGQMGARFYVAGPSESQPATGQFHLQTCITSYAIAKNGVAENSTGTQATIMAASLGAKFYGIRPGNLITVSGVANSAFDGKFPVISTDQYQFSKSANGSLVVNNNAPSAGSASDGGTVTFSQTDFVLPMPSSGSYAVCTIDAQATTTGAPPNSNTTIGGYQLAWAEPSSSKTVRFYQIYRREGTAPAVGNEMTAQQWLLTTQPAGTRGYYDYSSNLAVDAAHTHYAIVTKDRQGNRSAGVCMTGSGVSEPCN